MEYDEDRELTRYVWEYCQQHMSEFECRVGRAIIARAKAEHSTPSSMADALRRIWGAGDDPVVEAALADGPEAFRRRVRDRLLSERAAEVVVLRCPACGRVAQTPKAGQCRWCGHDWHDQQADRDHDSRTS